MKTALLYVAGLLSALLPVTSAEQPSVITPPAPTETAEAFADKLLGLTESSRALLQRSGPALELAPVLLPRGRHLLGVNDHYGWPVATLTGKSIVLVCHRLPQHWGGKDKPDAETSSAVALRSTDGGKTWSEPVNLRQLVRTPTAGCRLGFGNTIGTDKDGAVVVVTSYGVFRSEDEGVSWKHLPGAFGKDQLNGPRTNNGPRLALHPQHGLLAPGHVTDENSLKGRRNADRTPYIPPELWLRWSQDGGRTWQEAKQELPALGTAIEPSALVHEGALFLVARCHGPESYEPATKTWRYVQLWSPDGWLPLRAALANIRATDVRDLCRSSHHGPWTQDTVELGFNPRSGRIECVATDRNGDAGAGAANSRACQTLNLWSIDPTAFRRGESQWRFEGTLLKRSGLMAKGEIDGMHPGAAVTDPVAGVQHIFIYAGTPTGPSGVFRLTRTLDTTRLSALLLPR
jgi:hypothetical protein